MRGAGGTAVLVLVAAIVALPWLSVARELRDPRPVAATTVAPTGLVWGGRVFTSKPEFVHWLRAHGETYGGWAETHARQRAQEPAWVGTSGTGASGRTTPGTDAHAVSGPPAAFEPVTHAARAAADARSLIFRFALLLLGTLAVAAAFVPASMPQPRLLARGAQLSIETRLFLAGTGIALLVGVMVTAFG